MTQKPIQPISFPEAPAKILIIKPSALGDIVHTLPFLAAVRATFPAAEIHWVVARGLHTFLEGHPMISRLWIMEKEKWKQLSRFRKSIQEINAFRKELAGEHFDVSIDLSGLLRSGLITFAAGARYKLGFSDSDEGSPFFYTHKVEGGRQIHAIDRYLKLAALMGCDTSHVSHPMPPYPADSPLLSSLPEHFCIIAPSAGKEANRWPADRFGELAARLPLPSVVISSKADAGVVEAVVAASKGMAIDMAGKTGLKELVALIARARFLISNDTGPMHIAAALDVPVFAIFGPANPIRTGPYGTQAMDGPVSLAPGMDEERPQAMDGPVSLAPRMDKERPIHTIIQERLDCIPCYRQKPCQNWACMKNLSVEKVRQEIVKRGFISEQANLES